jgi:hypothetical protein
MPVLRRNRNDCSGSILLKKDFERGLRATLIQGERRTSNIDSKLHLLGFDCFKL